MKVAVLGANGRVSNIVAKAFLAHGHDVVAVTRTGEAKGLAGKVEFRAADATSAEQLIAATSGVDLIFNGLNPPYDKWEEFVMPMARAVMAAARTHGVPHLFIGNVYNYGKQIPLDASPETRQFPETSKAKIRIEMEALFRREAMDHGVKTVILRAGDFYGTEGTGSWFDQMMITKIEKGTFTWPGPVNLPHAFAYTPDLAEAFVALAERMADLPVYDEFTFEGHTLDGKQFQALVEKAVGRKLKTAGVPWFAIRLMGLFQPILAALHEMRYLWFTAHSLSNAKLKSYLGEIKTTPPAQAVREALIAQGKKVV